jgi:hypothetical protein
MKHVLIGLAVTMVLVVERLVRAQRRRGVTASRPSPDEPLEEHLSSSGRIKAVVYAHDRSVMRVEVFRWVESEPGAPFWLRITGPSFADRRAVPALVREAIRTAGGGVVA